MEGNDLDLYTALSIFATNAPKLINDLFEAAKAENHEEMEELAAELITYSSQAQLTEFTNRIKNLIIAVREHDLSKAEQETDSLRQCFEQMIQKIDSIIPITKIELQEAQNAYIST
jgi:hypothetical protein